MSLPTSVQTADTMLLTFDAAKNTTRSADAISGSNVYKCGWLKDTDSWLVVTYRDDELDQNGFSNLLVGAEDLGRVLSDIGETIVNAVLVRPQEESNRPAWKFRQVSEIWLTRDDEESGAIYVTAEGPYLCMSKAKGGVFTLRKIFPG
jgi:hypothetical protein